MRSTWLSRRTSVWFLWLLTGWLVIGQGCRKQPAAEAFARWTISGSSMEPGLRGERQVAYCPGCSSETEFATDSFVAGQVFPCEACGRSMQLGRKVLPAEVQVEMLSPRQSLRRLERVVLLEPDSPRAEVKRLVGFPHEKLAFLDGDLYVQGTLFQKNLDQFLEQAIQVADWAEAVGRMVAERPALLFRSRSLWPRVTAQPQPHPSPILDGYRCHASEDRWPVVVRDIGVRLQVEVPGRGEAHAELMLWVDGSPHLVRWRCSESGAKFLIGETAVDQDVPANAHRCPSPNPPGSRNHGWQTLVLAHVDGRFLGGIDGREVEVQACRGVFPDASGEQPVGLRLLRGSLAIRAAEILRDIHYRGPRGEEEFALDPGLGYHLLGDNVSNSWDSRQRWPQGVSREWILGRLAPPTDR